MTREQETTCRKRSRPRAGRRAAPQRSAASTKGKYSNLIVIVTHFLKKPLSPFFPKYSSLYVSVRHIFLPEVTAKHGSAWASCVCGRFSADLWRLDGPSGSHQLPPGRNNVCQESSKIENWTHLFPHDVLHEQGSHDLWRLGVRGAETLRAVVESEKRELASARRDIFLTEVLKPFLSAAFSSTNPTLHSGPWQQENSKISKSVKSKKKTTNICIHNKTYMFYKFCCHQHRSSSCTSCHTMNSLLILGSSRHAGAGTTRAPIRGRRSHS